MYVYIYIFFYFTLFYLSIIITNIVDHQTCFKKMFTRNWCFFHFWFSLFSADFGIWLRTEWGVISFGFMFIARGFPLFCSASSSLSKFLLWLRSSALMDDAVYLSYLYNLRSLSISYLCIFLYSSIVCFALVVNIYIYIGLCTEKYTMGAN